MNIPSVLLNGSRVLVHKEILDELGLQRNQSIDMETFGEILRMNLARCHALIAIEKAAKKDERSGT